MELDFRVDESHEECFYFSPFSFILMTIKHIVYITNNAKKIIFVTVVWNIYIYIYAQHLHFYITERLNS